MNNKKKIGNVLLLLIIIYFSCNSFILAIKYQTRASAIMVTVTVGVCLLTILKGRFKVPYKVAVMIGAMTGNILWTMLLSGFMNAYLLLILNFLLAVAMMNLMSRQDFLEAYIAAMKILSIVAVVVGLINTIMPSLLGRFPLYSYADAHYRDVILAFQNISIDRINGIWGEPGMFSVYLVFALIFELFYVHRPSSAVNYIIFIVTISLTFSTNGIICTIVLMVLLLFKRENGIRKLRILLILSALMVLLVYVTSNVDWVQEQFTASASKLDEEDISLIGRLVPVLYNLQEGIKNPLFGHGLMTERIYVDYSFYTGYIYCNTSTTTILFYSFGLVLSSISVYLMFKLANLNKEQPLIVRSVLFLLILINVNTQAVHLDQIYWMILFIPFMVEPWDTNELEYLYDEEN